MNARARDLRFDLSLPVVRFGPLDLVAQFLGSPPREILSSLLRGEPRRQLAGRGSVEVFPLRLPVGEGLELPLSSYGAVGFKNDGGLLQLSVPQMFSGQLRARYGASIVRGPQARLTTDGAVVDDWWLRLQAGRRLGLPLGSFGELAIEVAP